MRQYIRISAIVFSIIIFATAPFAAADSTSAKAKDVPLCKVSLHSLSKTTGAPGDTFEMIGDWEATQGAKTAAINMGAGHQLDVVEWTPAVLKVRIPEGLGPGVYKVGVYCNNPPHWQGSGFKDFTVVAKAVRQTDAQGIQSQGAVSPLATEAQPDKPISAPMQPNTAGVESTQTAGQKAVEKKQPVRKAQPEPASDFFDNQRNIIIAVIILIFAAILTALIYRYSRRRSKTGASGDFTGGAQSIKSSAPNRQTKTTEGLAPFSGVFNSAGYVVENLGDAPGKAGGPPVPIMTVSIDIDKPLPGNFELNGRDNVKRMPPGETGRICMELIMLGADYIDVGYSTSRVAAEVPTTRAIVDKALAEKIVDRLIKLRDLAQHAGR